MFKRLSVLAVLIAALVGLTAPPVAANVSSDYSFRYTVGWNHQYTDRMGLTLTWWAQADGQGVAVGTILSQPEVFNGASCDAIYSSVDFRGTVKIWNTNGTALYTWNPGDNADCDWRAGFGTSGGWTVNTDCAIVTVSGIYPHVKDNPDPGPIQLSRTVCD